MKRKLKHKGEVFKVEESIAKLYPDLIILILNTESMDNDEREYWFDILPSMADEQVDRLYLILETEKKKLEKLEEKYQDEVDTLDAKHLIEWQEFIMKDTTIKRKKERDERKLDDADKILDLLDNLYLGK